MADAVRLETVGFPEATAALQAMGERAAAALGAVVMAGAQVISDEARALVPKKTRTLYDSINAQITEQTETKATAQIGPSEPYGKYVEFGTGIYAEAGDGRQTPWRYQGADGNWVTTVGTKPQPFMRPAWDNKIEAAKETMRAAMAQIVTKAGTP